VSSSARLRSSLDLLDSAIVLSGEFSSKKILLSGIIRSAGRRARVFEQCVASGCEGGIDFTAGSLVFWSAFEMAPFLVEGALFGLLTLRESFGAELA